MKLPLNYELVTNFEDSLILAKFDAYHPEPYVVWKVNCGVLFDGVYFSNPKEALRYFSELINKNGDFDNTPINKPYVEGGSFSERLRFLRKERGLTQEQLAKELGISYSSFRSYESGTKSPNCKALLLLESFFDLKGNELVPNTLKAKILVEHLSNDKVQNLPFSKKLQYLRKQANLTQNQLAELIEVSSVSIKSYENGRRKPTGEILIKLSKTLNYPAEKLISESMTNIKEY